MIRDSIATGLRGVRRRPGLVVLIYGMNLALAFVLAVPVYVALSGLVSPTGFGDELAAAFDVTLWADILEKAGPALQALRLQLLWMLPLYLVWKAAAGVGLVQALRGDQIRPFWQGVGRYTGRAVLLALLFLVPLAVLAVGTVLVAVLLNALWQGEVGAFWTNLVLAPTFFISGLVVLDLMHDYARNALVVEEQSAWKAALTGLAWPFRHGASSRLYLLWFVPAALLLALPTVLDANVAAASGVGIWLLFVGQQVVLLLRAGVTVGWLGSEVAFFEAVRLREAPLIAEAAPAPADPMEAPSLPGAPDLASA